MPAQKDNMAKLAQALVILGTIVGGCFAAYSFVTERPSRLLDQTKAELLQRLADDKSEVRRELETRATARDRELQVMKEEWRREHEETRATLQNISEKVERIDERLDDFLPRGKNGRKSAAISGGEGNGS